MSEYQKLRRKIAELQEQAEKERQKEISEVVADIKAKMAQYDLTPSDLGLKATKKAANKTGSVPAKYRDPGSGKTWTGRGRAPKWVAEHEAKGGKREDFAIS